MSFKELKGLKSTSDLQVGSSAMCNEMSMPKSACKNAAAICYEVICGDELVCEDEGRGIWSET